MNYAQAFQIAFSNWILEEQQAFDDDIRMVFDTVETFHDADLTPHHEPVHLPLIDCWL